LKTKDDLGREDAIVQRAGATHVRWVVMGIVMAIMAVTAMNRLNLSIAGKYIEEEFSFNTISMGRVFSAFLWGYGLGICLRSHWTASNLNCVHPLFCDWVGSDGLRARVRDDHGT